MDKRRGLADMMVYFLLTSNINLSYIYVCMCLVTKNSLDLLSLVFMICLSPVLGVCHVGTLYIYAFTVHV